MDPTLCANLKKDQVEAVASMLDALEFVVAAGHVPLRVKERCRSALAEGIEAFDPKIPNPQMKEPPCDPKTPTTRSSTSGPRFLQEPP